jgi:trans-aconitate methyltransferase
VQTDDAVELIRDAVAGSGNQWADLGAGRGTFTRALVELLGADGRVVAVDREASSIAELQELAKTATNVSVIEGDITQEIALPPLDGILLANALHFVKEPGALLARLVEHLEPGGRVVIVEYDRRAASRWVPYPIGIADLPKLAAAAKLSRFTVTDSRPSNYEGTIYCAVAKLSS